MSQRTKYVEIQKGGEKAKVMPSSVPVWEKHGWTLVDDGDSEARSNEPQAEGDQLFVLDTKNKE